MNYYEDVTLRSYLCASMSKMDQEYGLNDLQIRVGDSCKYVLLLWIDLYIFSTIN